MNNMHYAGLVFDAIEHAIIVISPEWTIESCNRSLLALLGYAREELDGRSAEVLFKDHALAAEFMNCLRENLSMRESFEGQVVLRHSAGTSLPVLYQATALRDPAEDRLSFMVTAFDSTAKTIGEQETRSLARFSDENPNPVLRISGDGTLLYANQGSWLLLSHWKIGAGESIPPHWAYIVHEVLKSGENREVEEQIGFKTILLEVVPVTDMGYVNLFGLDVTQRKQVEQKLLLNSQVFENATEGVMITDADLRILDVNRAFCIITGYAREEILGESVDLLSSGRHEPEFYESLWRAVREKGSWQGEIWDRRKSGEVYPQLLSISSVLDADGSVIRYIGLFSDISVMKRTQDLLYQMANYDNLTGLANRRYFHDRLEQDLAQARRAGEKLAAMFIDLDGFKLINDQLGHRAGDQLLREVADRLKECVRESDTVGRMGGDEFTVVLTQLKHPDDVVAVAQKILHRIREAMTVEQRELFVSASIGISNFPEDATEVEGLLRCADAALLQAKDLGKNSYQFFSQEINTRSQERLSLQIRLRKGLDSNELVVHYQPQMDSMTGCMVGVEALVRWRDPEKGVIAPDQFIPLAEDTGLIHEIGEFVLRAALAQARKWRKERLPPFRMAINVSAHQLRRADFITGIEAAVRESGVPADSLVFELTESVLVEDSGETLSNLERLKGLGARLAIDDFGTKYSSLAYLKRLPIDILKIDKMFIKDFPGDAGSVAITNAIIVISRSLSLEVIAEGVETEEQVRLLQERGCNLIQGHYFCKPLPSEDLRPFMRSHL